jgi:3-oxoacyl-[acyl-carrier protein] reductase
VGELRVAPAGERRVGLVTGATTGLGRAEALMLARAGRDVAVHAYQNLAAAEETAAACRDAGARALVVQGDIRRSEDVRALVERVVSTFGRLDILVNNAGRVDPAMNAPLLELSEEQWHRTIDSHLTGTFLCVKHAGPHMVARRWGRIVNTSSIHGRVGGRVSLGHYGAAKAALVALTKTAARELGPHGITVNVIAPGFIRTPALESMLAPDRLRVLAQQVPLGRIGEPAEVAAAVAFLASDEASYVTGAVLDINGGRLEYV